MDYALFGEIDYTRQPNLRAWRQRLWSRRAVQRRVDPPYESTMANARYEHKLESNGEAKEGYAKL